MFKLLPAATLVPLAAVRTQVRWLTWGLVLVSGVFILALLLVLRQQAEVSTREQSLALTQVIEEQTTRTLQTVDVALQQLADAVLTQRQVGRWSEAALLPLMRRELLDLPYLRALWVLDAEGRMVLHSDGGHQGLSMADREYYLVFAQAGQSGLQVGAPVRSRVAGTWFVSAARPLRSPSGQLLGVVAAALEPPYFNRLWQGIDLGEGGTVTLMRNDGTMLMRSPLEGAVLGRRFQEGPLSGPALQASTQGGFELQSTVDGLRRQHAFRRLSAYPQLTVTVGQTATQHLQVWRNLAAAVVGVWLLAAVLVTVLMRLLLGAWRRGEQTELHFQQLAQAMPLGLLMADAQGQVRFANQQWLARSGQTEAQARGEGWLAAWHPDDRPAVSRQLAQLLRLGLDTPVEARLMTEDGRARWHLLRGAPAADTAGRLAAIYLSATDIDDIRSARQALADSEAALQRRVAQLQAIHHGAPVGLAFVDRDLVFVDVNERLAAIHQQSVQAHLGRPLAEVLPAMAELLVPLYRQVVDTGVPIELVELSRSLDGEPGQQRTWLYSCHPVCGPDGQIMGASSAVLEVTDLRRSEAAQRCLQEQLQQVQRLESIGQLTGGIAHDFNNLLTVILGNAELLAEALQAQPRLQRLAQVSRDAATRGADLTHRLLAFGRRQALNPRPVDVNQLLAHMDGLLRRALRDDLDIELVRGAGLWAALVDPAQLESAVLNLAINARDAMPDGGRLTLETANVRLDDAYAAQHAEVQAGQYVMLAVCDTGEGMSTEQLARVFEPFFTTKPVGRGTGLGLSMVYGFVKQSQGHIKIYSEPGLGTTVKMYLPRADADAQPLAPGEPEAQELGGHETVLLVEDDVLVRRHAHEQLLALGYTVLEAEDGPTALRVLQSTQPLDLLFTDVVMPGGLSGRQLAQAALALRPGLKVLYTSGYTENGIRHHDRLDRGVHLLHKPYRRVELARKLRAALADSPP